jgi:hypothetical protein
MATNKQFLTCAYIVEHLRGGGWEWGSCTSSDREML